MSNKSKKNNKQINQEVQKMFQTGCELLKAGQPVQAIHIFNQVILHEPKYQAVYNNLGLACLHLKQYNEAIQHLEEAVKLNKLDYGAHNNLGLAYASSGDLQKALIIFEELIKKDPNNLEVFYNKAVALMENKKFEEAIQILLDLIKQKYEKAYFKLADCYVSLGKREEAIKYLQEYQKENSGDAQKIYLLGEKAIDIQEVDYAVECFEKTIQLDSKHQNACLFLGMTYYNKKVYDKSIHYYQKTSEINPKNFTCLNGLGIVYLEQKEYEQALQYFDQSCKLEPRFVPALFHKGYTYLKMGKDDEALKIFNQVILMDKNYPDVFFLKAQICQKQNKLNLALDNYNFDLKFNNDSAQSKLGIAKIYIIQNTEASLKQAGELIDNVLQKNKSNGLALATKALLVVKEDSKNKEQSKELLNQAIELKDKDTEEYIDGIAKELEQLLV
ncbi:hypothetical protein ABPG74_015039 [Tetrahymena malaccensis]